MMISFLPYFFLKRYLMGLLMLSTALGFNTTQAHATSLLAAKPKQVVLLLHGMNSDLKTWNKLVDNNAGFAGHCVNVRDANFSTVKMIPNNQGIYCTRLNFGTLDRIATAPKGLDNKTCLEIGGCRGDYSTFDMLAQEIDIAISRLRNKFGTTVQVVLLGHSRGGIAARTFLQNTSRRAMGLKKNIVGLMTTGTPHAGTPLGRYYAYLAKNCTPESEHSSFFDFTGCSKDWKFVNSLLIQDAAGLDLKAPTLNFLSEVSPSITDLNTKVINLPSTLKAAELSYNDIAFGCLGGSLINSASACGYDIFGKIVQSKPSSNGLKAVLNGRARNTLKGDGIVPIYSQKMSLLKNWPTAIIVKSLTKSKRVHIAETEQVFDLTTALNNMYKRLRWIP